MDAPWYREIVELHAFFTAWLGGDPALAGDPDRFLAVHDEGFVMVGPDGTVIDRAALVSGLRSAFGTRPGLRITIEDARLHREHGPLLVATYVERQDGDGRETARRSTVLFRQSPGTPNGLAWLHVHETWLPTGAWHAS